MSYYPILKAPGATGWTTISNFAPNNWESGKVGSQFVNVTWAAEGQWITKNLGTLARDEVRTFTGDELLVDIPVEALPLLSLTRARLPETSACLPTLNSFLTTIPVWRATLGLDSGLMKTSYQGEIEPFPPMGTLLTFGPFVQFGKGLENYLLLVNIEKSPAKRISDLEVFDAQGMRLRGSFRVSSNSVNIIPIDDLDLTPEDLPLVICRSMAGVPLYFSRTSDGALLSLEHTHPPASIVVHGRRLEVQRLLKNRWFTRASA